MRPKLFVAVLVCTGLSLSVLGAAAQGQAGRSAAPTGADARVALVDVAYVFKNYEKFNRLYDQMKAEVKQREKEISDRQAELKSLVNKKQQFAPDSPNYKDIDQKLAQQKAELELLANNSRLEFTQKEANLYHQTYQEVESVIKTYAERTGITLVLRASRESEGNSNNPQEVIKEVSQQVVYAVPGMDITDEVLNMLNPKVPASAGKAAPTTAPNKGTALPQRTVDNKGSAVPGKTPPKRN